MLDGSPAPRLKICDFGYSKVIGLPHHTKINIQLYICIPRFLNHDLHFLQSALLHSQPKSTVGTPAYIAPEVLLRKEYDGKVNWFNASILLLHVKK